MDGWTCLHLLRHSHCRLNEPCEFVALDLEAFDINEAFIFRGFVLQNCTLYTKKKLSPHLKPSFHFPDPIIFVVDVWNISDIHLK